MTRAVRGALSVAIAASVAIACGGASLQVRNADNGAESCRSRCVQCLDAPRCPLGDGVAACALRDVEKASCASGLHVDQSYERAGAHDRYFACGAYVLLVPWGGETGDVEKYAFDASTGALVADARGWRSDPCVDGDRSYRIESRGGAPGFVFPSDETRDCKPVTLDCAAP